MVNVCAIIVTRGDHDIEVIPQNLPDGWEVLVWDNGAKMLDRYPVNAWSNRIAFPQAVPDLAVYGRYAAIEHTDADLIYVQDDDCIVSDPLAIVGSWYEAADHPDNANGERIVVCNMPQPFRHDFYEDHALVGFGACFHRDAPKRAFDRFGWSATHAALNEAEYERRLIFYRACDIVFTGLTPRVLVDVPYENLPWATADDRMYRQASHVEERQRMLDLVRQVRDS